MSQATLLGFKPPTNKWPIICPFARQNWGLPFLMCASRVGGYLVTSDAISRSQEWAKAIRYIQLLDTLKKRYIQLNAQTGTCSLKKTNRNMRLRAALRKIHLFALGHSTGTAVSQESTRACTLCCLNSLIDPVTHTKKKQSYGSNQLLPQAATGNLLASECRETSVGCHMAGRVDARRRFHFFTLNGLRLASWEAKEFDWRRPQPDFHSRKVEFSHLWHW